MKRNDIKNKPQFDYTNESLQKFRRIVNRKYMNNYGLENFEKMKISHYEIHTMVTTKILKLRNELDLMMPNNKYENVGERYYYVGKNLF